MRKILPFFLASLFFAGKATSQVNIDITRPTKNYQLNSDSSGFVIKGTVTSAYEITTFSAVIGNTPIDVELQPNGSFNKRVALASFSEDTLTMKITAVNVLGQSDTDSVIFIHNNRPVLTILEPSTSFVATPLMHIKLLCKDADTCNLKIFANGILIYTARIKDSIDANINYASAAQNPFSTLTEFSVTDKYNKTEFAEVQTMVITPQNSPNLRLTYKGAKPILDFKDSLVFVTNIDTARYGNNPGIININTKKEEVIPGVFNTPVNLGFVTPQGAIFGYRPYDNQKNLEVCYDWNNKVLTELFKQKSSFKRYSNILVSGNWASWYQDTFPGSSYSNYPDSFIIKNLVSKTVTSLPTKRYYSLADSNYDLADNGMLVYNLYNRSQNDLSTYKDGITTNIGSPFKGNYTSVFPVTDGKNVVYRRLGNGWKNVDSILFYNGVTTILLATYETEDNSLPGYRPANYYAVNNNYVAFLTEDLAKNFQVNLRQPSGVTKKLSVFGFSNAKTSIKKLAPNGDVMITYNNDLYLTPVNDTIRRVYSDIGKVYYTNAKWYIIVGNAIFEIDPVTSNNLLVSKQSTSIADNNVKSITSNSNLAVNVYPNPVNNVLTLNFNTKKATDVQVTILNIEGKKLQTKKVQLPYGSSIQTMNVAALSKGTYFVQCITKDGNTGIKFVKE